MWESTYVFVAEEHIRVGTQQFTSTPPPQASIRVQPHGSRGSRTNEQPRIFSPLPRRSYQLIRWIFLGLAPCRRFRLCPDRQRSLRLPEPGLSRQRPDWMQRCGCGQHVLSRESIYDDAAIRRRDGNEVAPGDAPCQARVRRREASPKPLLRLCARAE